MGVRRHRWEKQKNGEAILQLRGVDWTGTWVILSGKQKKTEVQVCGYSAEAERQMKGTRPGIEKDLVWLVPGTQPFELVRRPVC